LNAWVRRAAVEQAALEEALAAQGDDEEVSDAG
jgi:hypothetical protein